MLLHTAHNDTVELKSHEMQRGVPTWLALQADSNLSKVLSSDLFLTGKPTAPAVILRGTQAQELQRGIFLYPKEQTKADTTLLLLHSMSLASVY